MSPDADRERAGGERPDHRHDLDDAREAPTRIQYGTPIAQNASESTRDEHDQQQLAADERAELQVDERPRVAHDFRFGRGKSEQTRSTARSRSKIQ